MTPDNKTPNWLARAFWIAACGDILLVLLPALDEWNHPHGEFAGLAVFGLLAIALCLLLVAGAVALLRRPWAYACGLVLVAIPAAWFVLNQAELLAIDLLAPNTDDLDAGRGYFTAPADRSLAEAIVAGDPAKVAALAPAANLNAKGFDDMTFMQMALEHDQPGHAVLAALLKAGIDSDQNSSNLWELIYKDKDEPLLRTVLDTGVDLRTHMEAGHWYLFLRYDWPEELTLLLDHGADPEVRDAMGYTPIMRAAQAESWTTVKILLAHHARTDITGNDGRTLRDLVASNNGPHLPGIDP
jgi:ankyrin repeat protein